MKWINSFKIKWDRNNENIKTCVDGWDKAAESHVSASLPSHQTRTKALRFCICMRILSICYIFVEFSLFHVLRSVPKNYLKQSSLNSLKLKKSSIKWTTFRCHFLNNGPPRFINIKYMVWMDTHNTKGTPHKCSLPWHWLLVTWLMHVIYVRVWAVHRKELE